MKRLPELDRLGQSAYGDKVMGRVPENLCVQLLNGYEVERAAKQERRKVLCELLSARREKEQSVDEWLNMMQDYAQLEEVDRPTLVRLIQTQGKISVQGQICQRTKDFRLPAAGYKTAGDGAGAFGSRKRLYADQPCAGSRPGGVLVLCTEQSGTE